MNTNSTSSKCPYLNMMAALRGSTTEITKKTRSSVRPNKPHHGKLPPGPKGLPIVHSAFAYLFNPLKFLHTNVQKYGDIFGFKMKGRLTVNLNHPNFIQRLLVRDYEQFEKSDEGIIKEARHVMGNGLLTSSHHDHKTQRRLIQPAFSTSHLDQYGADMPRLTNQFIAHFKDQEFLNFTHQMDRLTLHLLVRTLFGRYLDNTKGQINEVIEKLHQSFSAGNLFLSHIWPKFLPNPFHKKSKAFRDYFEKIVETFLKDNNPKKTDLLSQMSIHLLQGPHPNKKEFVDHIITLLLAGHETTATTLNWSFTLLAQHPKWERLFHDEIDAVFGTDLPTVQKLSELEVTTMILKEAMRLYPAIWSVARTLPQDYDLGGYHLPAGTVVGTSQYVMHRDSRYFPDPNRFDPLRWTPEEEKKRPEFSYFPFGGGPRSCIGAGFSMMEMKLVIATLAQKWRFELIPNQRIEPKPLITLRPKYPIFMQVISRKKDRFKDSVV